MIRDATLAAGSGLDQLLRARTLPRPVLIGAGLVATGAMVALVHLAGTDPRAWMASGQTTLVPGLFDAFSNENVPAPE